MPMAAAGPVKVPVTPMRISSRAEAGDRDSIRTVRRPKVANRIRLMSCSHSGRKRKQAKAGPSSGGAQCRWLCEMRHDLLAEQPHRALGHIIGQVVEVDLHRNV